MATAPEETESREIATIKTGETQTFELMQREARLFSSSPLIPQHLRQGGAEQAMANCYIALKMARTMGEDPLVVLQNIHVVQGKAGFASQYVIARANSSGVFEGRINWKVDKTDPENMAVTAFAKLADTGETVEFTVDMEMARAENWTKNSKYKTMPEVMLRYRSAAFLVRFYAPDVMLGYHTTEEWQDVTAAGSVSNAAPLTGADLIEQATGEVVDAEPVDLAEVLDDEIPTFEKDEEPEPEQPAEPEPQDEAPAEDEPTSDPKADFLEKVRRNVADSLTRQNVETWETEWNKHRVTYDDDTIAEIDGLIQAKRKQIAEKA